MTRITVFLVLFLLSVSILTLSSADAQSVSAEARRYVVRGETAEEMAKTTEDYSAAIAEYQKAAQLAPNWPVPFYRLGLVQEKAGNLNEAIKNLRRYLQLAPNAPDAAKIRDYVYKLEYKAEQVLTVPQIIDALTSFMGWENKNVGVRFRSGCRDLWGEYVIRREGFDTVKVMQGMWYDPHRTVYQSRKITGPVLSFATTINVCDAAANRSEGGCDSVMQHKIEVVSRTFVKITQKVLRGGSGAGVADGEERWCSFTKKTAAR